MGSSRGILSDTFPSFERRLVESGISRFINGPTVISAKVGCFKPNPRIYEIAIERIGLPPHELVFIDNFIDNVMAGVRLGMHGVLIARKGPIPEAPVPVVSDLAQFEAQLP